MAAPLIGKGRQHTVRPLETLAPTAPKLYTAPDRKLRLNLTYQAHPGAFQTDWRHKGVNGSYDGLNNGDGIFYRIDYTRPLALQQIADGTSQTLMIGEDVQAANLWLSWPYANNANGTCAIPLNVIRPTGGQYPPDDWQNTSGFRSMHTGGANFAVADGSIHFVPDTIALTQYWAIATISGGEPVSIP